MYVPNVMFGVINGPFQRLMEKQWMVYNQENVLYTYMIILIVHSSLERLECVFSGLARAKLKPKPLKVISDKNLVSWAHFV